MRAKRVYNKPFPLTNEQKDVLRKAYDHFHGGVGRDALFHYIRDFLPQHKITQRQVNAWLKLDEEHQRSLPQRAGLKDKHLMPVMHCKPFDSFQIDLIDFTNTPGEQGKKYIMMIVDEYSRYLWAYPITEKSTKKTDMVLEHLLTSLATNGYPYPKRVQTDSGVEFKGDFDARLRGMGISHTFGKPGVPQTQGKVERLNGTIKKSLFRALMRGHLGKSWVKVLPEVVDQYNDEKIHSAHGMSPRNALLLERDGCEDPDFNPGFRKMKKKYDKQLAKFNSAMQAQHSNMGPTRGGTIAPERIVTLGSDLKIGDKVRVGINTSTRQTNRKKNAPKYTWSKEIYTIANVVRNYKKLWEVPQYKLEGDDSPRQYLRGELQLVFEYNDVFR